MISIVGLGPGDPDLITRRGWAVLTAAPHIWLRTRRHPAAALLGAHTQVHSYDDLYERHHDFAEVYAAIAADVVARGQEGDVVYAVPGDPAVAEATTPAIQALAAARGIPCTLIPGVSFLEPTFQALGQDPIAGVQIVDALTLAARHHPPGSPDQGLLVVQLYNRFLAGEVKLTLMNAYPDDHLVTLVIAAGTAQARTHALPLYELDRRDLFDDLTTLWAPPVAQPAGYDALQEVIAHLRAPEGCPWDREQTHESLRPYLLEEAYEALAALDADDAPALAEELGDLLIQVALHVQIATEEGEFKLGDVIGHVVAKLIRRHPHVFGDVPVAGVGDVIRNWETIKQAERAGETAAAANGLLDGLPHVLPALALAQGYVKRLARVGYPLPALAAQEATWTQALLALIEQAEAAGIDAEGAARRLAAHLRQRLTQVEEAAAARGRALLDLPAAEQRALWQAAT